MISYRALLLAVIATGLIATAATAAPPEPAPPPPAASLAGLWEASRVFSTGAPEQLLIRRLDGGLVADFRGRLLAVDASGDRLAFAMPGDAGHFEGHSGRSGITGHWIQPGSAADNGRYATPVTLRPTAGGWIGEVSPRADTFSFQLALSVLEEASLRPSFETRIGTSGRNGTSSAWTCTGVR